MLAGNTISLQSTQIRKDKSKFPVEVTLSTLSFEKEELVIALVRDITERKKAENDLKFSKEFSESVINSVDEALLVIDVNDFRIVDANAAALKQTGCSKEELIEKTCYAMTHYKSVPCQPPNDICPVHEMLKTGRPVRVEHKHFDKNNNELFVEVSVYPIRNVEGKIIQATHISRDITETKKDRAMSKSACNQLNSLFLAMNEGFCLHELIYNEFSKAVDYTILEVNPAYELIIGLKKNEVIGRSASEIYGSNEAPYLEVYAKVVETKEPVIFETYFAPLKKNFSISVFSPNKDQFATVFTDITERKEAEEKLKNLKAFDERIINSLGDALLVIDPDDYRIIALSMTQQ